MLLLFLPLLLLLVPLLLRAGCGSLIVVLLSILCYVLPVVIAMLCFPQLVSALRCAAAMPYKRKAIEEAAIRRFRGGMRICAEIDGESIKLRVLMSDTIYNVKALLSDKLEQRYSANQLRLFWGLRGELQDGKTLSYYNIRKCAILRADV